MLPLSSGEVGFGFRGGGFLYGRKNFAERTNAEYIAEHIGDTSGDGPPR